MSKISTNCALLITYAHTKHAENLGFNLIGHAGLVFFDQLRLKSIGAITGVSS
jgi:hypothetical protein